MSYHIYTTPGIILKRSPFGEADILLHVLTLDFGLIMASARSARVASSKLRPALQEYTEVNLSCIKGKSGWKITNVVEKSNYYFESPEYAHKLLAQVSTFLIKMIPGESPNREVFKIVKSGFDFLKVVQKDYLSEFETLMIFRILKELGYVVVDSETKVFLEKNELWNQDVLDKVRINKTHIISLINKALKESQL